MNNEIPREVENAIRKLRNNDMFVDLIWTHLSGYRAIRNLELEAPELQDEKDSIDSVLRSLDKYTEAANDASRYGYGGTNKLEKYLDGMNAYWSAVREKLEDRDGRKTKQESLLWLVETLLDTFNAWAVPQRQLTGFIVEVLHDILPEGTAPSRSSIQSAKKTNSN